ncbi:MAG: hypothetical protein D6704_12815 [Nitrospirae bacterium]|nr:MAG: hypothetical protein D6704_12815 [Nitrospirota bacterium]
MPTLEERVAYLEGKVEEHSRGFADIRDMIVHLDQKVDRFREELSARIDSTNTRIDTLDAKFSRYFLWTIGIQITVLLTVISALLAR